MASLTNFEATSLLLITGACIGIIVNTFHGDGEPLIASLAFSGIAFASTYSLIRWLSQVFMSANLKGKDMSKVKKNEMYVPISKHWAARSLQTSPADLHSPEGMGAVSAVVYLLTIIVFIPFPFYKDIVAATSGGGNRDVTMELHHVETGRFLHRFPHSKVRSPMNLHM